MWSGFAPPLGLRSLGFSLALQDFWDPPKPDLIYINGGQAGGKGRGEQKTRFSFALNLSGSGNPEYAIHRVVEPEIDHIES